MGKKKISTCLNCSFPLKASDKYCPACGQENVDIHLSFGKLISDFFANYFSFDSRFGRSFKPFFLNPGKLTNEFMDGKRMKYANPIRLYILVSLVHFFLLNIHTSQEDSSIGLIQNLKEDSTKRNNIITFSTDATIDSSQTLGIGERLIIIQKMAQSHTIDDVIDSLHLEEKSYLMKITWRQLIKLEKAGKASLKSYLLKNIPILMFFLLPIYALILKLLSYKRLYIHHVIHSLHLHSFIFILLIPYWLLSLFLDQPSGLFLSILFLLGMIYLLASFHNTYNISYWKSFYKLLLSGLIYFFVLGFSFILTFLISFYTY